MLEELTVHHNDELAAALRESEELLAALGATQLALFDLAAQRDRADAARKEAEAYGAEIEKLFQERRAEVAMLETGVAALEERWATPSAPPPPPPHARRSSARASPPR